MANGIRGWLGPKCSRHLSYSWVKIPEKISTRKTDPAGIERRPTRWETTMLALDYSGGRNPKHLKVQWVGINRTHKHTHNTILKNLNLRDKRKNGVFLHFVILKIKDM